MSQAAVKRAYPAEGAAEAVIIDPVLFVQVVLKQGLFGEGFQADLALERLMGELDVKLHSSGRRESEAAQDADEGRLDAVDRVQVGSHLALHVERHLARAAPEAGNCELGNGCCYWVWIEVDVDQQVVEVQLFSIGKLQRTL